MVKRYNNAAALIVAAGRGIRFGGAYPKQYAIMPDGRPVLRHTVDAFLSHPGIASVCVVIHPDDKHIAAQALKGLDVHMIHGAGTRQDSVYHGLLAIASDRTPSHVLIHDGARPFVSSNLITQTLDALKVSHAVAPALQVVEALAQTTDGKLSIPAAASAQHVRLQTPQGFAFSSILQAHHAHKGKNMRDDTAIAHAAGMDVHIFDGCPKNIKITHPTDLEQNYIPHTLSAHGYDVHKLEADLPLILCGIRIEHSYGLVGHSDADVAWHALTDALLGCGSLGDIGTHFPPSDPQWKDADSGIFLQHAVRQLAQLGMEVIHVDVTLVCQAPKITPYREVMRNRTAHVLGLSPEAVNIKATTTEGLGFAGRGEGIAAYATATVRLTNACHKKQETYQYAAG